MKLLPFISSSLFAATKSSVWFIDGNNVIGHRGTPKDQDALFQKIEPICAADSTVFLVFDGKEGVKEQVTDSNTIYRVNLLPGISADDYIFNSIQELLAESPRPSVQVVTADKELRRRVLEVKPRIVKNVVNPVTFYRRYLPRLCGYKLPSEVDAE